MDGDTIRVAKGLRVGIPLCLPHDYQHCGARVDSLGTHGLSYRKSQGSLSCHASVSRIIQRHLSSAGIPAQQRCVFIISDGKCPDGVTIMPWKCGCVLVWDVTCPDTYAPSHVGLASGEASLVAAKAEQIKNRKYVCGALFSKSSGVFCPETITFFQDLGRRLRTQSWDPLALSYLKQEISVPVQRGKTVAVLGTVKPVTSAAPA